LGRKDVNKETFLIWDRPYELKGYVAFSGTENSKLWFVPLKGFRLSVYSIWRSGLRYTPVVITNFEDYGRPIYETDPNVERNSEVGSSWFWTDIRLTRSFKFSKTGALEVFVEIKNAFDNLNSQIINPVTGTAYRQGDAVAGRNDQDPNYRHPFNRGTVPNNPARYMEPRQLQFGLSLQF